MSPAKDANFIKKVGKFLGNSKTSTKTKGNKQKESPTNIADIGSYYFFNG